MEAGLAEARDPRNREQPKSNALQAHGTMKVKEARHVGTVEWSRKLFPVALPRYLRSIAGIYPDQAHTFDLTEST